MNPALMALLIARMNGSDLPDAIPANRFDPYGPLPGDKPRQYATELPPMQPRFDPNIEIPGSPQRTYASELPPMFIPSNSNTLNKRVIPGTGGMFEGPKLPHPVSIEEHQRRQSERRQNFMNPEPEQDLIQDAIRSATNERTRRLKNMRDAYNESKGLPSRPAHISNLTDIMARREAALQDEDVIDQETQQRRPAHVSNLTEIMANRGAQQNPNAPFGMLQSDANEGVIEDQQTQDNRPLYEQLGIKAVDTGYQTAPQMTAAEAALANANSTDGSGDRGHVPSTPINRGVESAMQARRASYGLDDEQKQQAMGLAIMQMAQGFRNSKDPSVLGSIYESFGPAMNTYISERDKMMLLNKSEIEHLDKLQKEKAEQDLAERNLARLWVQGDKGVTTPAQEHQYKKTLLEIKKEKDKQLRMWEKDTKGKTAEQKKILREIKKAEIDAAYAPYVAAVKESMAKQGVTFNEDVAVPVTQVPSTSGASPVTAAEPKVKIVSNTGKEKWVTKSEAKAMGMQVD